MLSSKGNNYPYDSKTTGNDCSSFALPNISGNALVGRWLVWTLFVGVLTLDVAGSQHYQSFD